MRGNNITDRNGKLNPNYKDGRKRTRLYRIYYGMKTRCYNSNSPQYQWYGEKGITICDEWNNFESFKSWSYLNGYKENLTIDRIDYNGKYEPLNCRWVTIKEQSLNKSNNHIVVIDGEKKTLIEWCKEIGINFHTVQDRIKRGWSEQEALLMPVQIKFRRK